jgi:hypothetical protein
MPISSGSMSQFRSKRVVDLDNRACTCGLWNVDQFPCACAIAVAVSLGKVASVFVATTCHHSYFIQDTGLLAISSKGLKPLLAINSEGISLAPDGSHDTNVHTLLPPPKRTKETHGKNKRKRKESSQKASKTTGRTHTRSYVCASASKPMKKESRQICSICARNGRKVPKEEWRKAKYCPYKLGDNVKVPLKIPTMTRLRARNKMTYKKVLASKDPSSISGDITSD